MGALAPIGAALPSVGSKVPSAALPSVSASGQELRAAQHAANEAVSRAAIAREHAETERAVNTQHLNLSHNLRCGEGEGATDQVGLG